MLPTGSLVNAAAVVLGSSLGLALGRHFPERVRDLVFQALGLSTMVLGMSMALHMTNPLIMIFSLLLGGIAGELVRLEDRLAEMGHWIKRLTRSSNALFTDGLVTATLLFCVGSMAIVGAMEDGLKGDPTLLYTKSLLDGFASIALASTYGLGVLFAAVPVLLYQGGLTLGAAHFRELVSPPLVAEVSSVGGVLILAIGINLLKLTTIRIGNLLPSLLMGAVLAAVFIRG